MKNYALLRCVCYSSIKSYKTKSGKKLLPVSELFQKERSSVPSTHDVLEISRHLRQGDRSSLWCEGGHCCVHLQMGTLRLREGKQAAQ